MRGRRACGGARPGRGGAVAASSVGACRFRRQRTHDARRFVQLVRSCHFGCLFSSAEASAIGNLDCLRLGCRSSPAGRRHSRHGPERARLPVRAGLSAASRSPICCNRFVATRMLIASCDRASPRRAEFSWRRTVAEFLALWQGAERCRMSAPRPDRRRASVRFIVLQPGARMSYAVPALLARAGMLERFYTDICADVGLLRRLGPIWPDACDRGRSRVCWGGGCRRRSRPPRAPGSSRVLRAPGAAPGSRSKADA